MLELGCGTGRVTAPLAERTGSLVVGLDIDREMLAVARARHRGPLVCADMRRFALNARFGVVAIPFSSVQQLDDAGRAACFAAVAAHLAPGGVLALEITRLPMDELASVELEPIAADRVDGVPVLLYAGLDVHEASVTYLRRFDVGGETSEADVTLAAVTRTQIEDEARAAGVENLRLL